MLEGAMGSGGGLRTPRAVEFVARRLRPLVLFLRRRIRCFDWTENDVLGTQMPHASAKDTRAENNTAATRPPLPAFFSPRPTRRLSPSFSPTLGPSHRASTPRPSRNTAHSQIPTPGSSQLRSCFLQLLGVSASRPRYQNAGQIITVRTVAAATPTGHARAMQQHGFARRNKNLQTENARKAVSKYCADRDTSRRRAFRSSSVKYVRRDAAWKVITYLQKKARVGDEVVIFMREGSQAGWGSVYSTLEMGVGGYQQGIWRI
ncbi:hypothetical protein BJ546DRAFT_291995 [Cryomyces antarcticus]